MLTSTHTLQLNSRIIYLFLNRHLITLSPAARAASISAATTTPKVNRLLPPQWVRQAREIHNAFNCIQWSSTSVTPTIHSVRCPLPNVTSSKWIQQLDNTAKFRRYILYSHVPSSLWVSYHFSCGPITVYEGLEAGGIQSQALRCGVLV